MNRRFVRTVPALSLVVSFFYIFAALPALAQVKGANPKGGARSQHVSRRAPLDGGALFLPAVNYDSGGGAAWSSEVADLDGDGNLDVIVSNYDNGKNGDGSVGVFMGNGDGTLRPVVVYDTGGWYTETLAIGDLNGDGKPDVLVTSLCKTSCPSGSTNIITVLLNNGDGTLRSAGIYSTGGREDTSGEGSVVPVVIADLNHDGIPDVVVLNQGDGNFGDGMLGVLIGNGDGTFQPVVTYDTGGFIAGSFVVADLNGDGKPDMAVINCAPAGSTGCPGNGGTVGVLLGKGDGTFLPVQLYNKAASWFSEPIVAADLDGDGKMDLLVGNACMRTEGSCVGDGSVGVFLGKGDGTFQPEVTYDSGGYDAASIVLADVNGDGKQDLVLDNGGVGVMLGNGDGTYQPVQTYPIVSASGAVAVTDVNGDGYADLIETNGTGGSVSVFLGLGDGTFGPAIVFPTSSGGFTAPVTIADLNGDGRPDLVAVNWGGSDGVVSVLINVAGLTITNTALTSSQNPANYGQSVTFTATVSAASGTPTGTVIFYDGSTSLGSVTLAGGSASFITSKLTAGSHPIIAKYQGTNMYVASASPVLTQVVNGVSTSTTLVSSLNPSNYGQEVTVTASVGSSSGTPTGTVIFYDGSTALGSVTLAKGSASFSTSSLGAGSHSMTAAYQGTTKFAASTSAVLSQIVNGTATSTALTSSLNPSVNGQSVTFTATVSSSSGTPTGTVIFYDGSTALASPVLSGGSASFSTSSLATGTHEITAAYQGSGIFESSTSPVLEQVVDKLVRFKSHVIVRSSGNPVFVGQPVTFIAYVSSKQGSIPDGDQVEFKDGFSVELGIGLTQGGAASITTTLPYGQHAHVIHVYYLGDPLFAPSSTDMIETVNKDTTTTVVSASPNPAAYGQPITITATVTSTFPGTPTGSVRLSGLGEVPLVNGVATLTKALKAGTHAITGAYKGDDVFAESTSAVFDEVVNPAATTTALVSSLNPSSSGQTVTFTATVTSSTGVDPFGNVTFTAGTTTLGTVAVKNTQASISTATLPVGSTTITATYSGAAGFIASSSSLTQVVQP
jgi:Bacterial Ig-like domain (group 3)/FG-GAP-like repeat